MTSAAKQAKGSFDSTNEADGAPEKVAKSGPSRAEAIGNDSMLSRKGITDSELPVSMAGSSGRHCQWTIREQNAGDNLSGHDTEVELLMVPDFMGQSGQGANQSTLRPIGSV